MKQITLLFILLLSASTFFTKDPTFEVFKDYFDSEDSNYEFNARNPLYVDKFYIEDLDELKGKIIKETYETYRIGKDGLKSYSDSYERDVMYKYFIFDSKGVITDEYYIDITDIGNILYKTHVKYICTGEEYEIIEEDLKRNTTQNYKAKITSNENELILTFDKQFNFATEMIFGNNKITKIDRIRSNKEKNYEYQIDNDQIYVKESTISKGIEEIFRTMKYEKCCLIEEERYLPSGNEIQKYENTGKDTGILVNEGEVPQIVKKYIRTFNPIGFLEYEESKPYDGEEGNYSIRKREVLSKPDEFFNEHF